MSTKPTDAGRFAVDGGDIDAINISAPSGSVRNTGFPDDYVPPAAEFNYLENIAYRWRQWLDDGDVDFNDVVVLGTLDLAGDVTVAGLTTLTDGVTRKDLTIGDQTLVFADRTFVAAVGFPYGDYTAVAHTLRTGDGPFNVVNTGGALPVGLDPVTDYWAIRNTADVFRLASSKAFAFTGIAIAISDVGAGTHKIVDTVSTLAIADLNVSRDLILTRNLVLGYDVKHGDRELCISAAGFHAAGNTAITTPTNASVGGVVGTAWKGWAAAPNNAIVAALPLRVGDRVKSIKWYLSKASDASAMDLGILSTIAGTAPTAFTISVVSDVSAGAGVITHAVTGINSTLSTNSQVFLRVTAVVATQEFYGCDVTYDHP